MSLARLRMSAVPLALVLLSGCGGSSSDKGGSGSGEATTVTFKFVGGMPAAVAARIGSGTFSAQALQSGVLSLSIPDGTTNFAVAYVCIPQQQAGGVPSLTAAEQIVFEASTADGSSFSGPCVGELPGSGTSSDGTLGTLTASVDASAVPGASILELAAQGGTPLLGFTAGPVGTVSAQAPTGTDRAVVLAYSTIAGGPLLAVDSLVAARDFPGQTVPGAVNGGQMVVLGAGDQTVPQPISYSGVPSGFGAPSTLVSFSMKNGEGAFVLDGGATDQYPALPAGAVESGDSYSFFATARSSANPEEAVNAVTNLTASGPVTLTFPAPWSYAGPAPAALPTLDFNYSGFSGKGVIYSGSLVWTTGNVAETVYVVDATSSYLNGSTQVSFPDLSGLEGFLPAPASGTSVVWVAEIAQGNPGPAPIVPPGASATSAENGGSFTVP